MTQDGENKNLDEILQSYKDGMKMFRYRLKVLSKKAVSRVLDALLSYPIEKEYPKFTNKEEQDLFVLIIKINQSKNILINEALKLHNERKDNGKENSNDR